MDKHKYKFMPNSRMGRTVVGILLIIGGILGALPVLGFWMIPLGFVVLSVDSPRIRRFRRRAEVNLGRRWRAWRAKNASKQLKQEE